jgi:Putative peptidoglycan binding domain
MVRSKTATDARVRERNSRTTATDQARVRSNLAVNRDRNFRANSQTNARSNVTLNRERNMGMNRNVSVRGGARATVTNNWRSSQFSGRQYAAFRNYHRTWHDRGWWRSHFNRVIFVSGGWWYWNAGYWYPAWGYDPYAYYPDDGPIYGYSSDLAPDQVVTNVQAQLQRDGYYRGPVDGVLGPMTRQAIAAFQADHGLAITSTVDEPTLDTLGVS